jgi:hypothetical protein
MVWLPMLNALLALTLLVPVANVVPASINSSLLMVAPPEAVAEPANDTVADVPDATTETSELGWVNVGTGGGAMTVTVTAGDRSPNHAFLSQSICHWNVKVPT